MASNEYKRLCGKDNWDDSRKGKSKRLTKKKVKAKMKMSLKRELNGYS